MANRAERRRLMRETTAKNKALIADYTQSQLMAGLAQNGITPKDLEKEYHRGYQDGLQAASLPMIKTCYAAICLALHDEFDFGEDECFRALTRVDERLLWTLENRELSWLMKCLKKRASRFNSMKCLTVYKNQNNKTCSIILTEVKTRDRIINETCSINKEE